jgi:formylglycine-generating enzyme required for sulfatase activity
MDPRVSRTAWGLALALMLAQPARAGLEDFSVPPPRLPHVERDCADCPEMVVLPAGLAISRGPVTRREFAAFAAATGRQPQGWGCSWFRPEIPQSDDDPVVCATWRDGEAYAAWLAGLTGRGYRLPTVEEWTYAASAGAATPYWWGSGPGVGRANCKGCGSAFDGVGTSPVGSFPPNWFGLHDMLGNAWQWTATCREAACENYVLKGGSWANAPADLTVAKEIWNTPDLRFNTYGLRVVRDP